MLVLMLLSVAGIAHAQPAPGIDMNAEIDQFMHVYRPAEDLLSKLDTDWVQQMRDGNLTEGGRQCLKDRVTLDLLNRLVRPMVAQYSQDAALLQRVNDFYSTPAGRDLRTFEIAQAKKAADDSVTGQSHPLRSHFPPGEAAQISAWQSSADFAAFQQVPKNHGSAKPDMPDDALAQMSSISADCHALK